MEATKKGGKGKRNSFKKYPFSMVIYYTSKKGIIVERIIVYLQTFAPFRNYSLCLKAFLLPFFNLKNSRWLGQEYPNRRNELTERSLNFETSYIIKLPV